MLTQIQDLAQEQAELESLLRGISPERWLAPTPAQGWDVRDQVSHLADTEEIAFDSLTGGPRRLAEEAKKFESPDAFTLYGCERGRAKPGEEVLAWWSGAAARTREAMATKDPKDRIPWGLGMSARTFVTARLMETWAHGLDVRAALGVEPNLTARLKDVVWLIVSAFPYAFMVAKRERPAGDLLVELQAPGGGVWRFGPDGADNVITGDAGEFCRVGVQRMKRADAKTLRASGPLADAALDVARAFL